MKTASSNEIKQELKAMSFTQLVDMCLRLARYKKENKELLTFLLFEARDVETYVNTIKNEMDEGFAHLNTSNLYLAKKSLRKILRNTNKYIRYAGMKTAEADLLLHFCLRLKESKLSVHASTAINNLYQSQLKKINAAIESLHEDLQHDYRTQVNYLNRDN